MVGLTFVGLLLWWVLGPAIRFAVKLLAVLVIAGATALALALLLGQSPEGEIGWGLVGFLVAAVISARMIRRSERSRFESWTERPPKSVGPVPAGSASASEENAGSDVDDGNSHLRRFDRLGLTKAARTRRDSARFAAESATAWTALSAEAGFATNRIAVARRSCEDFARTASSTPFNTEALAHLVVVQKRVPEMIRRRLALCSTAALAERRRLLDDLVDQLEQIAAEGERRLSRGDPIPLEELETERAYLRAHFSRTNTRDAWTAEPESNR